MKFHEKRRQQFLTETAYWGARNFFEEHAAPGYLEVLSSPPRDSMDHTLNADAYADEIFSNYLLRYTAGESLDALREDLDHVVFAFEQATKYVREFQKSDTFPPLRFIEIDEYERVLQLIGLCFLLHRRDLLANVAAMFDPSSAARDTLYEDMLAFEMKGRSDIDRWYHEAPYRDIINSLFRDSNVEIISDFQNYLKNWYKSLKDAPWHDSHLEIEDDMCAGYFGYWAIEAAALAYLLKIDDSSFREHLVYPKDLVDFARKLDASTGTSIEWKNKLSRVAGGTPCPNAGYWMTPAKLNSRRFFEAGEIMPIFSESTYGETFWQWSLDQ